MFYIFSILALIAAAVVIYAALYLIALVFYGILMFIWYSFFI